MALARRLLRLRPHLGTLPLPSPSLPRLLPSRTYISGMRRSAFIDRLLRSVRSEISFVDNSAPPPSPLPPAPFAVEDRPGEQWARLRRVVPAAEGGEEEVRVDATLVDGALPPSRSGADTGGPLRLHISVKVEVSKAARPGVALIFECSAWPDEMEVQRVFPVRRGGPSPVQQYVGRQFSELDEEMQSAVRDYLEQRGVNDELAAFLHAYMENKEHNELTRWLKNVELHVKH
ncbi:mitochondrial glycoprotein [Panicum miliaceum]|uniref:Mitochondrial glycoprotein n=1 Tax=Panicum miliaceum TaxID=4540 RepID=A0A3L6PP65_PANMI|nr:mitochondrial glycoprotein [Panicum miliaceum]